MVYTLRFFSSLKCSLFHNSNLFGSCIIHILYTECAKIKKYNSGAKRLKLSPWQGNPYCAIVSTLLLHRP
jgi:hypothetical protein